MDFFQQVAALNVQGILNLTITTVGDKLAVNVFVTNTGAAAQTLPPMAFSATPEQIDAAFFKDLSTPIIATATVLVELEAHAAAIAKTKQEALKAKPADKVATTLPKPTAQLAPPEPPKEETPEEKIEREKREAAIAHGKKYDAEMVKVDKLVTDKKYEEALRNLPKPDKYPTFKDKINTRRNEIIALFNGSGLF